MTTMEWLLFILILQCIHFGGTWKLYQKAGFKAWEAAVPIYNAVILMQIIRRPKWWVLLLFIPIINLMMIPVVWVETLRSFGRNSAKDTALGLLTFGLYIYTVNYDDNATHIKDRSLTPRTAFGEWVNALLFAIIAATLVHTYFIQPYIIPTSSLEKSLLVGDFLFVSKFHYGARTPMSAVAFPMVHDTLPIVNTRSYLKKPQLPYFRLPGFQKIERNEIVTFSWPADTVRQFFVKEKGVRKPIDKKSNYVKRCVGIPGDTLAINDGFVFINGSQTELPERAKTQYTYVGYNAKGISSKRLKEEYGLKDFSRNYKIKNITQTAFNKLVPYLTQVISNDSENFIVQTNGKGLPQDMPRKLGLPIQETLDKRKTFTLTLKEAENLQKTTLFDSLIRRVKKLKTPNTQFFPNALPYDWNEDQFGPIYIPKKGTTVALTTLNLPLYKKIIKEYENNTLERKDDTIFINGKESSSYTFQQDYYWMMGDNRHKSEDSRFWGFVPEDHIVGKPILVWFSIEGINDGIKNWRIRWDRVMTTVKGKGKPFAFGPYVFSALLIWQIVVIILRRRKAKA